MKYLFTEFKTYLAEQFNWKLYGSIALFLIIIFTINYRLDFEDRYVDTIRPYWLRGIGFTLFQMLPFLVGAWLVSVFTKANFLGNKQFWLRVLVAFAFLGFYRAFAFSNLFCSWVDFDGCQFVYKILRRISRLIMLGIPLLIFWKFDKQHMSSFYGLSFKLKSFGMYMPLLAIMVVIIGIASFFDSIQNYYPLFAKSKADVFIESTGTPRWLVITWFETTYAFTFISIEYFFRGFLIYSLVKYIGPHVVLPMACTYAVLHFGKPFPEAFSSIFGGYVLGILSLRTGNIWGGVFLHGGIALLMEFFTFIH